MYLLFSLKAPALSCQTVIGSQSGYERLRESLLDPPVILLPLSTIPISFLVSAKVGVAQYGVMRGKTPELRPSKYSSDDDSRRKD